MIVSNLLLIVALVALNGFFVGVEFAAVASRRSRLDLITEERGGAAMQLVRKWVEDPPARDRLIAASQLGITLVSLALGAVGENTFEALLAPHFHDLTLPRWLAFLQNLLPALPLVISLIVVTGLHVVLGEQVPKVAVLHRPERFALFAAPFMSVFSAIFKWFISLLDWATHLILALFGLGSSSSHNLVYSLDEIKRIMQGPEVEAAIQEPERDMISAVLDFGAMLARQVSIPRTEIVAVDAATPVKEALNVALENGVTKMPVFEGNLDQVVGIVHLRDLINWIHKGLSDGKQARELAREVLFVPETIPVNNLLHQFRARRSHIAIVLDEYGGTSGLVTLEDLLEEIIGDVQDPFETARPQLLPDGAALIDGMTPIEEVNEHFAVKIVDPYYDTIAGYILSILGRIPEAGDRAEDRENGIRLEVEKMDRLRIALVRLVRL